MDNKLAVVSWTPSSHALAVLTESGMQAVGTLTLCGLTVPHPDRAKWLAFYGEETTPRCSRCRKAKGKGD